MILRVVSVILSLMYGWFSSKEVLVPAGLARIQDDNVYFDSLSRDTVEQWITTILTIIQYRWRTNGSRTDHVFWPVLQRPLSSLDNGLPIGQYIAVAWRKDSFGLIKTNCSGSDCVGKHVVSESRTVNVELTGRASAYPAYASYQPTDRSIGDKWQCYYWGSTQPRNGKSTSELTWLKRSERR